MAVKFREIGWLNVSVECCVFCSSVFLCEKKNNCEIHWGGISLTELTDLTDPFCAQFRTHRTPPAYRIHRTFQLMLAVRFCEIGWLNVSVECCVFCSSVFLCEKKNDCETHWGVFSLIGLAATSPPNPLRMAKGLGYEAMPRRTGQQGKGWGHLFSACSPCSQKGFCSSVKICER